MPTQVKISVSIPMLEKEYDVSVPDSVTGEKLFKALMKKSPDLGNPNETFELYSKRLGKRIYPDYKSVSLEQLGVKPGDTIIVKKDEVPGALLL